MRKIFMALFILILPFAIYSQKTVKVGMTSNQPPYSFEDGSGLASDMITEINGVQKDFVFQISILPPERGRQYFKDGSVQILAMTNILWGYDKTMCKATKDLIKVQDKYFARKDVALDQKFFEKAGKEETVVVNGFNYKILNFITDQEKLKNEFNTSTVNDEPTVIKRILAKRGKIGISSSTTLGYFSVTNPAEYKELLISDINDSEYYRYFLIRNDAPVTVDQFNGYVAILEKNGVLKKLFAKYGLK